MKKIYMILVAAFIALNVNAQVDVTFQVDMTDYLKVAGNKLATIKIAGNFAAANAKAGAVAMVDWTPPATPKFTNVGNVWSTKITFPNASKGTELLFKFLNTADTWGACGVDQECFDATTLPTPACTQNAGDFNRVLKIPTAATTVCFKFNTCATCTKVNTQDLALDADVNIAPNPASGDALLTIATEGVYNVDVTTVTGQVVRNLQNVSGQAIIERDNLTSGMYFVVIRNAAGKFQTQKLIFE
jgi:hypothetical protein